MASILPFFFGSLSDRGGYEKRLRAVVQKSLLTFASDMKTRGHAMAISDDLKSPYGLTIRARSPLEGRA